MISPNPHIAAMAPYALADLSVPAGKRLVSLAQNESPLAPSPRALAAGQAALAEARLYSDPDWSALRAAIAAVHGLDPAQILCGAGSLELIAGLLQCYAGPGDSVLGSQHTYAFFGVASRAAGADFVRAPEPDMTVSVDALLAAVDGRTRVVCVVNPGNPTGTRIPRRELVRLREALDAGVLLVIDEAYGEYADAPGESTFNLAARGDTVVLRTFSKAYGLAGLRVGWGALPPAVAAELRKVLNPNNVSGVSQAAAAAAMADQDHRRRVCAETAQRRDRFAGRVRELGLHVAESHTNFVVIRFADADAAARADRALRAEGVLLRGLAGYGLPDCLRATVGSEADMELAAALLAVWRETEGGP